ncbi:hypothetical protein [Streptosporangium roseum]|uniref:hypothetical protein n=1 Tax=Streptosporangium roseum TaxID=2001 RepID=UPI003324951B
MRRRETGGRRRGILSRRLSASLAALALAGGAQALAFPSDAAVQRQSPYTCKQGFVWREAFPGDLVCVTPAIRTRTTAENAAGPSNQQPGSVFCRQGFVWREARPSDLVCVVPSSRDQARSDNAGAPFRLVDPGATPRGGVQITTSGNYLYAMGTGLSPNNSVRFYAVGINTVGPYSLGFLVANAQGALSGWNYVATISCRAQQNGPATIVVLDQGSGTVTTGGITYAFQC